MKHCVTYEGMRGKHSLIPVSYFLGQGKISPGTIVSRAIVFYELAKRLRVKTWPNLVSKMPSKTWTSGCGM
ncbi:hypothetical protein HYQ46_006938 [Verticillium longisporum]|nr:hypothetical protein HYQ44_015229 [Verticillium longisporum]KAG7144326.1 hypothetical protein HYQ46_006938 [Verticillium longisporum]